MVSIYKEFPFSSLKDSKHLDSCPKDGTAIFYVCAMTYRP